MKYMICNILWKNHNVRDRISRNEAIESIDVLFGVLDSKEQVILSYASTLNPSMDESLTSYDLAYLQLNLVLSS